MDSAARPVLDSGSIVRLPKANVAVGLFVGLYLAGESDYYLSSQIAFTSWSGVLFALVSSLAFVALVLVVIVLNRPLAILIGVAAGTASGIAQHYWTYRDSDFVGNFDVPREGPGTVLMDAFVSGGILFGIVGFVALYAGRRIVPRATTSGQERQQPLVQLPSTKTCLWLFGGLLLIDIVATQAPDSWFWREIVGRGLGAAEILLLVGLFLAVFAIFRPWAIVLVAVLYVQQVLTSAITSGCFGSRGAEGEGFTSCAVDLLSFIGVEGAAWLLLFAASAYACRRWADIVTPDRISYSGGDSISSSTLPAGSRT